MKDDITKLNRVLLNKLLEDLYDSSKCTPGLYQVIRGVVNDNRDHLDSIPADVLQEVEDMIENTPFKFGT